MATKEQLEKALRNAHAAGDTAAAAKLAGELRNMQPANVAQQEFDELPLWQKPIKALDDLLRVGSDAVTFGNMDRIRALIGTQPDVETARAETTKARSRSGVPGDITAAVSATLPMLAMPQVAMPATAGPVVKALGNTAMAGLEGAAFSGLDALGHGEDVLEAQGKGAAFGAGSSAVIGLLGKGLDMLTAPNTRKSRVDPFDLRLEKERAYNAMEDEGVAFKPSAVDDLLGRVDDATSDAWPGVQGGVIDARSRAKKNLRSGGQGFQRNRTLTQIDKERQNFRRDAVNNPQTTNQSMGLDAIKTIDDWLEEATGDPAAISSRSGDAPRALGLLQQGRELNQRVEKLDMLDEKLGNARRQAERNLYSSEDSTIKQNVGSILADPKKRRQFTADEVAQMELVNSGTAASNMLRQGGRMAPGGGWAWPAATAGGALGWALGSYPGAAIGSSLPAGIGILSKKLSSRSTRKQAEKLVDMVSSGKSLKSVPVLTASQKKDLVRFLTSMGITSAED